MPLAMDVHVIPLSCHRRDGGTRPSLHMIVQLQAQVCSLWQTLVNSLNIFFYLKEDKASRTL